MVTFQTPDGTPGFHQSETLDEAITFVERLRNEQGVHNSRIFRMEELKFDFKPYYKVEISSAAESGAIAPLERATPSSRPAPPTEGASLDLTHQDTVAAEPVKAPEPVGVAASAESAPSAPAAASPPLPPPPPPPAKDTKSDEPSDPPRRGLFTR